MVQLDCVVIKVVEKFTGDDTHLIL